MMYLRENRDSNDIDLKSFHWKQLDKKDAVTKVMTILKKRDAENDF